MDKLMELASRVEALDGVDHLLDALITQHFRLYRSLNEPIAKDRWIELREEDGRLLLHVPGDPCSPFGYRGLPFTASLDAALSLVSDGLYPVIDYRQPSCVLYASDGRTIVAQSECALTAINAVVTSALRARAS